MLKVSGHRLNDKHNLIIKKWGKRWKLQDAKALRKLIEIFDLNMQETDAIKSYDKARI